MRAARNNLSAAIGDLRRSASRFADASVRISAQRTETVAGIFGGSVLTTGAYVLCAATATLSFAVLGPLAGIVGISAGVLIARRQSPVRQLPGAYQRQIHIDQVRGVVGYLQDQISTLSPNAPKAVRDDLYKQLADANRTILQMVMAEFPDQKALPAQPLQLPGPSVENRDGGSGGAEGS